MHNEEHSDKDVPAADSKTRPPIALDEFRAELDVFSGPLDLLLHLIRQQELDILEIPISQITDSYLSALKAMQMFDINIASEFLVMAATLMDIKSRRLIPDPIDSDDEEDPKDELIHQLLEYKKFKQLAGLLRERADKQGQTYPRRPPAAELKPEEVEVDSLMEDIDIWDCVSAYAEVIRQIEMTRPQHIVYDEVPVARYMEEIVHEVNQSGGEKSFLAFFENDRSRPRIIGVFLALLELLRENKVRLVQKKDDRAFIEIFNE